MNKMCALEKPKRQFLNLESLIAFVEEVYDLPISKISIYRSVKNGSLPVLKANGRLLFRITDIKKWIEGNAYSPDDAADT